MSYSNKQKLDEMRARQRYLVEYMDGGAVSEINEEDPMGTDPMGADPMGGGAMGGDPMAGGADPMAGGDPNAMGGGADPMAGGDPNAMGGDPNAMGGDPNAMGGGAQGAEGFDPQGPEATMGAGETENIGGDPNAMGEEDEEVIDVDELTDAQDKANHKMDKILARFDDMDEKMYGALDSIVDKLNSRIDSIEKAVSERLPDPTQKISLMRGKSKPFDQTIEGYWQTDAPNNYSPESDENGVGMPKYEIKQSDIDDASDLSAIYRSFDDEDEKYGHMSLKDIYDL